MVFSHQSLKSWNCLSLPLYKQLFHLHRKQWNLSLQWVQRTHNSKENWTKQGHREEGASGQKRNANWMLYYNEVLLELSVRHSENYFPISMISHIFRLTEKEVETNVSVPNHSLCDSNTHQTKSSCLIGHYDAIRSSKSLYEVKYFLAFKLELCFKKCSTTLQLWKLETTTWPQ